MSDSGVLFLVAVGGLAVLARSLQARLRSLEDRVARLEAPAPGPEALAAAADTRSAGERAEPPAPATPARDLAEAPGPRWPAAPPRHTPPGPLSTSAPGPPTPSPPAATAAAGAAGGARPAGSGSEAPAPSAEPRPASPRLDWERWIGVRGAAVLGAVVLSLAAVLFLKYSIEHGLIPPIVRVAAGFLAGAGAIVTSEMLRRRRYTATADALAGAGAVILYASIWAARVLYTLIPNVLAVALMALVTLTCGLLSWRYRSLVIAGLGLAGGFATPLLLSAREDHPIGLFGYLLLLDLGLVVLARRRGWPILAVCGLAGTTVYQALWILGPMGDRLWLALAILAGFAVVFLQAGAGIGREREGGRTWITTAIGGLLLPLLFALYLASRADLGPHLYPLAALLLLLSAAAVWFAAAQGVPLIAVAAATADLAVVLAWGLRSYAAPVAWETTAALVTLAVVFHLGLEWAARRGGASVALPPAWTAASGLLTVGTVLHVGEPRSFGAWLVSATVLAALQARATVLASDGRPLLTAAVLLGFAIPASLAAHHGQSGYPSTGLVLAIGVALGVLAQLLALALRRGAPARHAESAAAMFPLVHLSGLLPVVSLRSGLTAVSFHAATLALALLACLAATRIPSGRIYFAAVALAGLLHGLWATLGASTGTDLAFQALAVVVFTLWPLLAGRRLAAEPWALYAAALAGPIWFLGLRALWLRTWGDAAIGMLPVGLGALALIPAAAARGLWARDDPDRRRALVWFAAVALGFLSLAIPLQLEEEWITLGWALEGAALLALWRQLDHPGLKYLALALHAAVTGRLLANPAVLTYHAEAHTPVLNWLAYTYLVPAAALVASARILAPLEVARWRDEERRVYPAARAYGAAACGVAALVLVFAWINLTIFDAFGGAGRIDLSLQRLPARDLTLSLAWALYALVLLALAMGRRSAGLRWMSLAFFLLTIGKVFLYDLGELRELYRVASLVGLALSLILVSLAYQRFVFRGDGEGTRGPQT